MDVYSKIECFGEGLGDIAEVENSRGEIKYIIQQERIYEYDKHITGSIVDHPDYFTKPPHFKSQLEYSSFHDAGIYSYELIRMATDYLFR